LFEGQNNKSTRHACACRKHPVPRGDRIVGPEPDDDVKKGLQLSDPAQQSDLLGGDPPTAAISICPRSAAQRAMASTPSMTA